MTERYHRRREGAVRRLGGCCVTCGGTEDLEFDPVDAKRKRFNVGKALSAMSEAKLWPEVDKCQLLCHECHLTKTLEERGLQRAKGRHGTPSSYKYCRCEECRAAKAAYAREYRERCGRAGGGTRKKKKERLRHGTITGYNYYKCRCPECRKANAARQREYRKRRGQGAAKGV